MMSERLQNILRQKPYIHVYALFVAWCLCLYLYKLILLLGFNLLTRCPLSNETTIVMGLCWMRLLVGLGESPAGAFRPET